MDTIYTYRDFLEERPSKLELPKRTGRRTTYRQWLEYQYRLFHDESLPAAGGSSQAAPVFVNHGRWLWECPGCLTAVQVSEAGGVVDLCCCPACFGQAFVQPVFPAERAEIEAELMRQPGYRWNAPFRNWEPGWSLAHLRERTAAAQAKLDAGATYVRSASIGTPRTWSVGEVLTAANMNNFVREIQKDLIGSNGPVEFTDGITPVGMTTTQLNGLSGIPDGTLFYDSTINGYRYFDDDSHRALARTHMSDKYAARSGSFETVNHDLGEPPRLFQLVFERVQTHTPYAGYATGAQVFQQVPNNGNSTNFFSVTNVGATSYDFYVNDLNGKIISLTSPNSTAGVTLNNDPAGIVLGSGWAVRVVAAV